MKIKMGKGGQSGSSITRLPTFEDLRKKQIRSRELQSLALSAYDKGYIKAGMLLGKIVERYYI